MRRPARIAVVDDDAAFLQYLSMLLTSRGYEVSAHGSGEDLLKTLDRPAPPAIVLLDVLMPRMDGLETLRAARAAHPDLQVIMLSGSQVPSTIVDAVRLGAVDYVVKPDDPSGLGEAALEAAVRNAIERVTLAGEVVRLRAQVADDAGDNPACWTADRSMRHVMTMIERVADSDVSVLLSGESGVGKEVVARELHRRSARRDRSFVKVNCAALPAELLESELFGYERGAFTGAQASRVGRFEFANGGTLLLDEIGEMPAALQAKLLHVLQDREFTRLGSNQPVSVDVRILAATNRDLEQMIRAGQFREDLYYRLQVIEIRIPPLRERRDEILTLVEFFLQRYARRYDRPVVPPSPALRGAILAHEWPGNIRELENLLRRFVILQDESLVLSELHRARAAEPVAPAPEGGEVAAADDEPASPPPVEPGLTLPELARRAVAAAETRAIWQALDRFHWNRRKAARALGVSYKTLLNKMKASGIGAHADASNPQE